MPASHGSRTRDAQRAVVVLLAQNLLDALQRAETAEQVLVAQFEHLNRVGDDDTQSDEWAAGFHAAISALNDLAVALENGNAAGGEE